MAASFFLGMIQTLVFDMGGVLMDHDIAGCMSRFHTLLGDNFHVLGIESHDLSSVELRNTQIAISNAARTSTLLHNYEIGRVGTDEFVHTLLPLCRPGTTTEQILEAWDTMHAGMPQWRLDKIREWHKQYPIFLLSNNNEEHWHHVITNNDINGLFDALFLSHILHVSKPSLEIFEMADSSIKKVVGPAYHKEHTIFIDDLKANRDAAVSFGWQACESLEQLELLLINNK